MDFECITTSELRDLLPAHWEAGIPVMVESQPGLGKSAVTAQAARRWNATFWDVRAALRHPVDFAGLPSVARTDGHLLTEWAEPGFLPRGEGRHVLAMEEVNRAPLMTQNALFQLVQEGRSGSYVLPAQTGICALVNPIADGGGVTALSPALLNRWVHYTLSPDLDAWLRWAFGAGIAHPIMSYLRNNPKALHEYSTTERAWPSPRTWHLLSRSLDAQPDPQYCARLAVAAVGKERGIQYAAHAQVWQHLAWDLDVLLTNPRAPIPSVDGQGADQLYALSTAVAYRATLHNIDRVMELTGRLPQEYAAYIVRTFSYVSGDDGGNGKTAGLQLLASPSVVRWVAEHPELV